MRWHTTAVFAGVLFAVPAHAVTIGPEAVLFVSEFELDLKNQPELVLNRKLEELRAQRRCGIRNVVVEGPRVNERALISSLFAKRGIKHVLFSSSANGSKNFARAKSVRITVVGVLGAEGCDFENRP